MNTNEFSGTKPRAVSAASVVSVVSFVREVLQPQRNLCLPIGFDNIEDTRQLE